MTIDPEIEWYAKSEWTEYKRVELSFPADELVYAFHLHYIEQPSWCSCDIWFFLLDAWREFVHRTTYVDIESTLLGLLQREICAEIDAEIIGKLIQYTPKPKQTKKSWWVSLMDIFYKKHRRDKR
jgi:hypothetical protein